MHLRYALYFAPSADDPLNLTAAEWLGRDAYNGVGYARTAEGSLSAEDLDALTADPRRYGFHATLKAPFHLAEGKSEADLLKAMEAFAANTSAFDIPSVIVGQLGHFFALVPDSLHPPLQQFAADVVETFEPFRAPLSEMDIARRKPDTLPLRQRENLLRWGYPYVFDEFRFHMTLTGPVPEAHAPVIAGILADRFADFTGHPLRIDGIALFIEPERGAPFHVHSRLPLKAAQQNG
jgi:putative phosphonate metabolism protein